MATKENYKCYIIPENMVDGSKIMGFKLRNIIEGGVMAGTMVLLVFGLMQGQALTSKLSMSIILAAPFLFVGAVGINGYPVSYFAMIAVRWLKRRGVVLYDGSIRLLQASPVDAKMEQPDFRDRLMALYEERIGKSRSADQNKSFVEGVDFKFAEDNEERGLIAARQDDSLVFGSDLEEGDSLGLPDLEPEEEYSPDNELAVALGLVGDSEDKGSPVEPVLEAEEGEEFELVPKDMTEDNVITEPESRTDAPADKKPHRRGKKKKKGAVKQ